MINCPINRPIARPLPVGLFGGPVASGGGGPTNADIIALYTANGWSGDFYDTHDPATMGGVTNNQNIQSIAGKRASISLAPRSGALPSPHWDSTYGGFQFHDTAVEQVLDPESTLGQLQDAFFICAEGRWHDGFLRLVCVSGSGGNPVLFDIRVGEDLAANPGGVSALVQNAQVNIANITGITVPAVDERFCVWMNREAGGNATLGIMIGSTTTTGTVTKGGSTGTDQATIRYAENYAPTGTDFYLGRSVFVKGASLTQEQIDTMVSYVMADYTAATIPTGKAVFGTKGADITLSNSDLTATKAAETWQSAGMSASAKTTGKFSTVFSIGAGTNWMVGLANASFGTGSFLGADANSIGYNSDGNLYTAGSPAAFGAGFLLGYTIKVEVDTDAETADFYQWINGAWVQQGSTVDISGLGAGVFPAVALYGASAVTANTGQSDYTVTSGYPVGWTA